MRVIWIVDGLIRCELINGVDIWVMWLTHINECMAIASVVQVVCDEVEGTQVELGHMSHVKYKLRKVNTSQREGVIKAVKHFRKQAEDGGQLKYDLMLL